MKTKQNKIILLGYRQRGIQLYRTDLKPLGYVVGALGFVSFGIAVFPNGLGFIFYPLGFMLLGLVGIELKIKKRLSDKVRLIKYKLGWF